MRIHFIALTLLLTTSLVAQAQVQQAGNSASTNMEDTFRKLVEQCDDTDVLMLRARIRLDINRTTEQAASESSGLLKTGLEQCGDGKIDDAKQTLTKALSIAKAGAEERFGETESQKSANAVASQKEVAPARPWWKFW